MLLRPGFRLIIDKSEPIDGKFAMCFQNACFGGNRLNGPKTLAALKKGQNICGRGARARRRRFGRESLSTFR